MSAPAPRPPKIERRYHFHAPGLMYIGVTVFLLVGAVNSQNNLLFAGFGLAIGGLVVSGFVSGAALMGVRVERLGVADTPVGQPMTVRYAVRNRNRVMPAFALHVMEVDSGPGAGATWRRFFGEPHAFVAHVGPGQSVECEAVVWPRARGQVTLEAVRVWSTFPFGVARKSVTVAQRHAAIARPPVLALRPGLLNRPGERARPSRGVRRAPRGGEEFVGVREYAAGDRPRDISWKRSARTGELVVSQTGSPDPSRLLVVLRLPTRERSRVLEERAVSLAASLIGWGYDQGMSCGLSVPQAGIFRPIQSGRWHADRILNELAMLDIDAVVAAGHDGPVPSRRDGICAVVSASPGERGRAPAHARHLAATELGLYLEQPGESLLPAFLRGGGPGAGPRASPAAWIGAQTRRLLAPVRSGEEP